MNPDCIIVLGPTASGKTRLAVQIASWLHSEIISADSRQVYRSLNIGTGKDYHDYSVNGKVVPYHLIDIVDANEHYDINSFVNDFSTVFGRLASSNKLPVICGGSALYIYALLKNFKYTAIPVNETLRLVLNQKTHSELIGQFKSMPVTDFHVLADLSTIKRTIRAIEIASFLNEGNEMEAREDLKLYPLIIGLELNADERKKRIEKRLLHRLNEGLIEEVKALIENGLSTERLIYFGLEYKFITQFVLNQISYNEMYEKLLTAIVQFSKRQMTFYRKMEREGFNINWIDATLEPVVQSELAWSLIQTYNVTTLSN